MGEGHLNQVLLWGRTLEIAINLKWLAPSPALMWGQCRECLSICLQVLKLFPEHWSPSCTPAPPAFIFIFMYLYLVLQQWSGSAKRMGELCSQGSFCQTFYITVTPSKPRCQHGSVSSTSMPAKLLNTNGDLVRMGLDWPKTTSIKTTVTKQNKNKPR